VRNFKALRGDLTLVEIRFRAERRLRRFVVADVGDKEGRFVRKNEVIFSVVGFVIVGFRLMGHEQAEREQQRRREPTFNRPEPNGSNEGGKHDAYQ
jgi:hypothetical protein